MTANRGHPAARGLARTPPPTSPGTTGPCAGGFCSGSAIAGAFSGLCGMKPEATQPLLGVCGRLTGCGWDGAGGEAAGNVNLPVPAAGGDGRAFSLASLPGWVRWCSPVVSRHCGSLTARPPWGWWGVRGSDALRQRVPSPVSNFVDSSRRKPFPQPCHGL